MNPEGPEGRDGCGGHTGEACGAHTPPYGAHAQTCDGHARSCGTEADACCQSDRFALPTTEEPVTVLATDLAWLLDAIEESEESVGEPSRLEDEAYLRSRNALREQAPRLVAMREDFLDRLKALMR
ncbi:MAG: hypothetical protein ACRDJF_03915 [Actinomycetota bacterium]